jgi:hypothetical protein
MLFDSKLPVSNGAQVGLRSPQTPIDGVVILLLLLGR